MSDPKKDAEALNAAFAGIGTDNSSLVDLISHRTNAERMKIKEEYFTIYGKDLIEDIKSEASGDFKNAIESLFYSPLDFDCKCLKDAMANLGTDESTLIEIIASRPNSILKGIIKRYKELYEKDLIEEIKSETSGDFQRMLVALFDSKRNETKTPKEEEMKKKAEEIFKEEDWNKEDSAFNKIFLTASPTELVVIVRHYHAMAKKTIIEAIEEKFSGDDLKNLYKTTLFGLICPSEYFAGRLNDSIKGLGTKEDQLTRVIVSRKEIDLDLIKFIYKKNYGVELEKDVEGDTSGEYKDILLGLIRNC